MIKVALIGIGGMGEVHYNSYRSAKNCKLIAVADIREEMAREKVKEDDINIYHDMDELLKNENPDIVDICTPSYMHADMSIKALESGINVLCEKPMTLNSKDAERVIEAVKKSGKLYMVAHVVRFTKAYEYLKEFIENEELGKLVRLDMKRLSETPVWSWENWMQDEKKSGGAPLDLSIHDVDFVQSVLGMPDKISGVCNKMSRNENDYILSQMIYGDTVVTTEGAWFKYKIPFEAKFTAIFQNGTIKFENGVLTKNRVEIELEKLNECSDSGINISASNSNVAEIEYFAECVATGTQPTKVMPESSKQSIELMEKIIENSIVLE